MTDSMIGRTLSRYRILAEVGRGGMGIVYRAVDERLKREVALKVVPPELVAEGSRQDAFLREARAVAALKHSNIAVVYEIDEHDGFWFMALELVEGGRLADQMAAGPMPRDRALEIAIGIADGLAWAHGKGIVHRDLKPANVLLSETGEAKIIDFGVARLTRSAGGVESETETRSREETFTGTLAGTLAYMSPEQARGEAAGPQSDVFSFGILLFQLLTGRRPFTGASPLETVSSILKDPVPPLSMKDPPPGIERLVVRCLEKDPARRYPSMGELATDLRKIRSGSGSQLVPPRPSAPATGAAVAVLPFTDMSPARDQDYFCQGMAEEIINALTKVPGLRVAARTSTFRFKESDRDHREIGAALNVHHLLEGSLRTSGDRLRVTAQLIEVADGYPVWSDKFDRHGEDVFDIQDEIAARIVKALRSELEGPAAEALVRRHTHDVEAYHLYLKGRHRWSRRLKGDLEEARGFFEQAVARDPGYSAAHAGVADVYTMTGAYGFLSPATARAGAEPALGRALELGPVLAEAHRARGFFLAYFDRNLAAAELEYRRAIEIDPWSPISHSWLGVDLSVQRRFDEGIAACRRAIAIDPLSAYAEVALAWAQLLAGRDQDAITACTRALQVAHDFTLAHAISALARGRAGPPSSDEAVAHADRAVQLSGRAPIYLGWLGWVQAAVGSSDAARRTLAELERAATDVYVSPLYLAWIRSGLGEVDDAFDLLEQAFEIGDPQLVYLDHPQYDALGGDARLEGLRKRLGLGQGHELLERDGGNSAS